MLPLDQDVISLDINNAFTVRSNCFLMQMMFIIRTCTWIWILRLLIKLLEVLGDYRLCLE